MADESERKWNLLGVSNP